MTLIASVDIMKCDSNKHPFRTPAGEDPPLNNSQFLAIAGPHQVLLEIVGESLDRRLNRPRRRIAQRAKRFTLDIVTKIQHELRIFGSSAAICHALEHLNQPVSSFATGGAPAA